MCTTAKKWFRRWLLSTVYTLGIVGIVASGGGGGDGVSVSFPEPTLPAGAVTLDAGNAQDVAESALGFASSLSSFSQFKAAKPPSIPDVLKQVTDRIIRHSRSSQSVATGVTEDLSALLCPNGGKAIANYRETDNSERGTITYTGCDVGLGVLISGTVSFDASWNDTTLDYDFRFGGTLTIILGAESATVVFDLSETGNDGTGTFSTSIDYSVDGIPGGGYLAITTQNWQGDFSGFTSGRFIVYGGSNTRLRITVVPGNMADVELDVGGGTFVYITTIPII